MTRCHHGLARIARWFAVQGRPKYIVGRLPHVVSVERAMSLASGTSRPDHLGARADMPDHYHCDVRFVVRTTDDEAYVVGQESRHLAWRPITDPSTIR